MGGESLDITRRDALKTGGLLALLGGGAYAMTNSDRESPLQFQAAPYTEQFSEENGGRVRTANVNRAVSQIGLSMPDSNDVYGVMCGQRNDHGSGYVEHRFVASHMSYAFEETVNGPEPLSANGFTQGVVSAETVGDTSGCGDVEIIPNHQLISPFPAEDFFTDTTIHTNSNTQYQRFQENLRGEMKGDEQTHSHAVGLTLTGVSSVIGGLSLAKAGVIGVSIPVSGTTIAIAGAIVTGASIVNYLLPDDPDPIDEFHFNSDKLRHVAKNQDSSGLFYLVDFSVRVPYNTAAYVDVEQSVDFSDGDIPDMVPAHIAPTKRSRLQIPAIDPPDDGNPTPKPAQFRPNYWDPSENVPKWDEGPGIESTTLAAFELNQRVFEPAEMGGNTPLELDPTPTVQSGETPTGGIPRLHGDVSKYNHDPFQDGPPLNSYEWRIDRDDGSSEVYHTSRPLLYYEIQDSLRQRAEFEDSRTFEERQPGLEEAQWTPSPAEEFYPKVRTENGEIVGNWDGGTGFTVPDDIGSLSLDVPADINDGFYTATLTARNDDGLMDRISKDFAIDRPVLPIVDHPEPLPIENEVTFRGYVTGPRADEVDTSDDSTDWLWRFEELDDGGTDTRRGRVVDYEFDNAVRYRITLDVNYATDEDPVTRNWVVRPSVEGTVVDVYADERPIPVGREVTLSTDVHYPDGEAPGNVTPTWTIRAADGDTELTTVVDEAHGNDLTHVFDKRAHEIRAELRDTSYDWTPAAREPVLPEMPSDVLGFTVEGPTEVRTDETRSYWAAFGGQDGVEGWPTTVERIFADTEVDQADLGDPVEYLRWTVTEAGGAVLEEYPVENVGEIDHAFDDGAGQYEVRAEMNLPLGSGDGAPTITFDSATLQVAAGSAAFDVTIEGPEEVVPGVDAEYVAEVSDHDGEIDEIRWTVVPADGGDPTTYRGPEKTSIEHSFDGGGTAEINVTVVSPEDGVATASREVTVDENAVMIEGPAVLGTYAWNTYEIRTGIEQSAIQDVEWTLEYADGDNEVPVVEGSRDGAVNQYRTGDDGMAIEYRFVRRGRYDVDLSLTVDAGDGREEVTATKRIAVDYHPAAIEISLDPPENCRDANVGSTEFEISSLAVDGEVVNLGTLDDWRLHEGTVEAEMGGGRLLLRNQDCRANAIRRPFESVPTETAVSMQWAVDPQGGEPSIPYVAFYVDGEKVHDSSSDGQGMERKVREQAPTETGGTYEKQFSWPNG